MKKNKENRLEQHICLVTSSFLDHFYIALSNVGKSILHIFYIAHLSDSNHGL